MSKSNNVTVLPRNSGGPVREIGLEVSIKRSDAGYYMVTWNGFMVARGSFAALSRYAHERGFVVVK
jgi:hypothetical protein